MMTEKSGRFHSAQAGSNLTLFPVISAYCPDLSITVGRGLTPLWEALPGKAVW
jgi:hypothetical protein